MTEGQAAATRPEGQRAYYNAAAIRRTLLHFLLGRGVAAVLSLVVAVLIVRALPVSDYAHYAVLQGLLILLMTLGNLGLERVVPRYFPQLRAAGEERALRRFFWLLLAIRLTAVLAVLLALQALAAGLDGRLGTRVLAAVLPAFAAMTLSYALSMHLFRCLQALLLNREATTGMSIEWAGRFVVLAVWLGAGWPLGLGEVLWVQAATTLPGLAWMLWCLVRHLHGPLAHAGEGAGGLQPRAVFRLGAHNYLWGLTGIHESPAVSRLLGGYLLSGAAVAGFGFAQALTAVLQRYLPATLLLGLIEPALMGRFSQRRDRGELLTWMSVVLKANVFVLLPVIAWFVLNGGTLIDWLTGGKYADSAWVVGVLLLVLIANSHVMVLQMLCNALEQSALLLQSNLWSLPGLALQVAAAALLGLPGLLAGTLAIVLFKNAYIMAGLRRAGVAYRLDWPALGRMGLGAALAGAAATLATGALAEPRLRALLAGLLTALVFLALLALWKAFSPAERAALNRVLGRRVVWW